MLSPIRTTRSTAPAGLLLAASLCLMSCGGGQGDAQNAPGGARPDGIFDVGDVSLPDSEPAVAPALPPTEVANAITSGPTTPEEAFRLLDQATFGATLDAIHHAAGIGPEAWIDEQMGKPATLMLPALLADGTERWNEYVNIWWDNAVSADDQLRQRVAFALSQILVVSGANGLGGEQPGLANYYDLLVRYAFGNYRDLLEAVTVNPIMGEFLSMKGNRKADPEENIRPDENYARELLQLFSIGLTRLNPDGTVQTASDGTPIATFGQAQIEGFASVFTGWHFANADDFRWPQQQDYLNPMKPWEEFHDASPKQLLDSVVLPAGQTAEQDLQQALDTIFAHPNVGPFIARQLIQRLVTSNPTPGYVRDVAAVFDRNAAGVRGSLASTVKAILMHRESRLGHLDAPDHFGKAREPLLRVTQLWRAFGVQQMPEGFNYSWAGNELAQSPLNAPSVFNFYRPHYSEPGEIAEAGLDSPEFAILDETSVITQTSRLLSSSIWSHNHKTEIDARRVNINIDRELVLEPDPQLLLDHLDLLLLGGRMTPALREETLDLMAQRDYRTAAPQRVVEAIFLIISSPEAAVQI